MLKHGQIDKKLTKVNRLKWTYMYRQYVLIEKLTKCINKMEKLKS